MRNRLLVLGISSLVLGLGAGPALADSPVSGQEAAQVAGSKQTANSSATSTQYNPSNQNISVRVLSPGKDGSVSQTNSSAAQSFAGNHNSTAQTAEQTQGGGGSTALQEAAQEAGNVQHATSTADSTQVKPSNQNISVRVLSPGDGGSVSQSNESQAKSKAVNSNELTQDVDQTQESSCRCLKRHDGGTGIQAAGQDAFNKQKADSSATSTQVKPSNENISVRVLSPGKDGSVSQTNDSSAFSGAFNHNSTTQSITQDQGGSSCGCHGGTGIQAAGQEAFNYQNAYSTAESKQIHPSNDNLSLRLKKSYGGGGRVYQANNSMAGSFAANKNKLEQSLEQTQG
jgi:hypothetical protein